MCCCCRNRGTHGRRYERAGEVGTDAAPLGITTMSIEKFRGMLGERDAFALSVVRGQRIVLKGKADPWV